MGRAEDIVRQRQAQEERRRTLQDEADERRLNHLLNSLCHLASMIRDELDRLEWPDASIQHMRQVRGGEARAIASWSVPDSVNSKVGSDGFPYIYGNAGYYISELNAYRDECWFVPVAGFITLSEAYRLIDVYEKALKTLRER